MGVLTMYVFGTVLLLAAVGLYICGRLATLSQHRPAQPVGSGERGVDVECNVGVVQIALTQLERALDAILHGIAMEHHGLGGAGVTAVVAEEGQQRAAERFLAFAMLGELSKRAVDESTQCVDVGRHQRHRTQLS